MPETAALLDWGAAVSFGHLASVNVMAVQVPYLLVALALIAAVVTLLDRPRAFAAHLGRLLAAALVARFVIIELVRLLIQTARPYADLAFVPLIDPVNEFSFPSGHTAVLSAIAFVTWKERPAAGAALLLGAVLVGIARVFAGVHWPVDIAGGVVAGALGALVAIHVPPLLARFRNS